ncbi:MarR family transcriptional regulator [Phototrophicus methaneseepsis]|uniref:MarR family transcriptional regulator n=1 Tax=Phototrophicus methaneseepsis TaxID=2710758 RepID=A0A7S8IDG5_9CHLR|nr:MarR family transcriptional regulator [Phototrophicus methaneseepsis]QPC81344.1 MarR family transcriptional regulator [Phototrophicus methaneseepsis]
MKNAILTEQQSLIWSSYQRMRTRLTGRLNRELAQQTGLSEADYEILTALIESPEPLRALALRCGLEWEKSRLSHQLRRMETRGLLTREECIEDNRGTVIHVTAAGRELAEQAKQVYDEAVQRFVIDVLTPNQLEVLGTIAETLLDQLEEPHQS